MSATRVRLGALWLLMFLALLLSPHGGAQAAPDLGPVPIGADDASRGSAAAPATLVVFVDFECPYCARLHATVHELEKQYGKKLRVVYKHNPLPFHKQARPAALAAEAVRRLDGERAYWRFADEAYDKLRGSSVAEVLRTIGADTRKVDKEIATGEPAKKVDADAALAKKIGANGTPTSFVNGVVVNGAQSKEAFVKIIDTQLIEANTLSAKGVKSVYVTLAKKNFLAPKAQPIGAPKGAPAKPADDTTTVWKVPIGRSPTQGPATAPVTLVIFSDFQCPFCGRAAPTVENLRQSYGDKLRLVFKNQPLPFHQRAEPAAQLALEAFARQGAKGFWKAHDQLFLQQRSLEDSDLEQIAKSIGLDATATMKAVHGHAHTARIDEDQALAEELDALGTPQFFINGRRLMGAQPEDKFRALIDDEIENAKKIVASGVPAQGVYDHIMKSAKEPDPPEKKTVPAPGKDNPAKGNAGARVTIQMFTDFECPFCKKVQETLARIEKEYGGRVRIVFRHHPLDFHTHAMAAHLAAAEAFKQGGNKAFWKMHDALFEHQDALERADLVGYARAAGLDVTAFEKALDAAAHKQSIESDSKIAEDAGIHGTPAFTINGYFVSGAQPYRKFKRIIDRALAGK